MIDPNYQVKKEEAKVYPPLPKNIYQVELLSIDLKDAKGKYAKPGDKNFQFQFTLLSGKDKDEDLRGRNVWNNFVPTALYVGKNGKNALYQIVEAFLGRELTPQEEAEGLSGALLNSFIGKQIKIFIDHRIKDGKTYNNITSYMPAETPFTPLTAEEKENARVKVKTEVKEEYDEETPQSGHVEDEYSDPEIKVENIPF
jgi:hypothetical protein